MKAEFIKDLEHMYLVFGADEIDENEYIVQMALRCRIPALLPLTISHTDGREVLRAEVTGCMSIASRYRSVALSGNVIRRILTTLSDTVRKLPAYLLDPGDLYLDPEYIFLGPGSDEILLCYVPHLSEEDPDTVRILAEFFLKKLDHSDRIAADLAYGLFDQVTSDQYSVGAVLEKLLEDSRRAAPGEEESNHASIYVEAGSKHASGYGAEALSGREYNWHTGPGHADTVTERRQRNISREIHHGNHREPARGGHSQKPVPAGRRRRRPPKEYRKRQGVGVKKLLPALIILAAAATLILMLRMDLTQIGGMGFLCAALIWLTYSTLEKRQTEVHNVWADEDDPGDDAFYRELLRQVYAEDEPNGRRVQNSNCAPDEQHISDMKRMSDSPYQTKRENVSGGGANLEQAEDRGTGYKKHCLASLQPERCGDISLDSSHMILGKSRSKADVILPDETVSRVHARIEQRADGWYVSDLYSTNGTFLDERRIDSGQAVPLKEGGVLRMGSLKYRVQF